MLDMLSETQCLKRTQNKQALSPLVFYMAVSLDFIQSNVSLQAWHDHPSNCYINVCWLLFFVIKKYYFYLSLSRLFHKSVSKHFIYYFVIGWFFHDYMDLLVIAKLFSQS